MKKYFYKFKYTFLLVILFAVPVFTACRSNTGSGGAGADSTPSGPVSKSSFKLDTIVTITFYDGSDISLIDECFKLCDYYEGMFSRTIPTSEVSKLNSAKTITASEEMLELLTLSLKYCELSKGIFDISIAPVSSLWDFSAASPSLPGNNMLEEAVSHVNYKNIIISDNTVTLADADMAIDLGASAKGFIADRIKSFLVENGVTSAIINLGGNVLLIGGKPDGNPFNIGIQKPFYSYSETAAIMQLTDVSVVSSGIYERCFTINNTLYHHLLDTKTGYPASNGLTSVTIISDSSAEGDLLSTTAFLMGLEDGMALIDSLENIYAVFITEDGTLHYSEGLLDKINVTDN